MPRPRSDRPYVCGPYQHRRKWRVVIYTPRGDGGRDRRVRSFDSRSEAQTWINGYEIVRNAAGRTVAAAVSEYVASLERRGNKASSIKTAKYRLDAILDFSKPLIDVTPRRAQDYYDELVDEGVAVDTQQGCLIAAKAFGRFCQEKGWLKVNPFATVEPVGKKSRGKDQLRIDEARTFRSFCRAQWEDHGDRSAIAALLPLVLSLRAGEVAQLVARDVDDRGRILMIGEQESKTEAGRRIARVPPWLTPYLVALAAAPATAGGHLFAKESGDPADRHWVSWHAKRLLKAAKVRAVTTHGLRGTFATLADIEGTPRRQIADAMGHTSTTMTEAHYIDPDAAAEARIDRVSDLLDED